MADKPVFTIQDLHYTYPNGVEAIRGLNAEIPESRLTVITGDNGAGKTTLLLLLDGLIFPTKGAVVYRGTRLSEKLLETGEFAKGFRRQVGLVFQEPDVQLFNPTVAQDLSYSPNSLGLDQPDQRALRAARAMGVEDLMNRPPHALSWGQKKRAALATVLAGDYDVFLLDEPSAGLDSRGKRLLMSVVEALLREGKTIVVVAHDDPQLFSLGDHEIRLSPPGT